MMDVEAHYAGTTSRPLGIPHTDVDELMSARSISIDENARFRIAVRDHHAGLWRFVRRLGLPPHRADDVAQTVFLITLEALPRIVVGSERAFLYATAVRVVHGIRRRIQREVVGSDLDHNRSPHPPPDDLAHQKHVRELFEEVVERIERELRAVFVRFEIDGLTIAEISTALSIPPEAATCRLRRARKQFRALVRDLNLA